VKRNPLMGSVTAAAARADSTDAQLISMCIPLIDGGCYLVTPCSGHDYVHSRCGALW
jgi:hypothetical protein